MPTITGTSDIDTLAGGAEADTITGGVGADVLTGGAGIDVFVFGNNDSPAASALGNMPAKLDVITDFTPSDRFFFIGANAPTFGNFRVGVADDYDEAYSRAQDLYATLNAEYIVIGVNSDTILFSPRSGQAVVLQGVSRFDIQPFNFTSGSLTTGIIETGSKQDDVRNLGAGADTYNGDTGADSIVGAAGADTIQGGAGNDQVFGGLDNDALFDTSGNNYLRGDEGADTITGGDGFDDINGNMGNDFCVGGANTDWVVGGKDEDVLFGEGGDDIVYGNLGNDTLGGGVGNDLVRGGQGDDNIRGDDGDDILAGDRGADQLNGGLGADLFLSFNEAGTDRVADFSYDQGDRVRLDPGTAFTLVQVGNDTVVDMGGGNQLVLVNVLLSTLPQGWITVG